ncbi:MAG: hypothetical protein ACLFTD_05385 [Halochromatium sp.]|uniref:hypothetical protein n=1 Tax=Halochromatium sp. TaxID=2049430 RepID=UPI00397BF638
MTESTAEVQAQHMQTGVDDASSVQTEPPITLVDVGIIVPILVLALWYLYRQLWRKRGSCGGCAKGGEGSCAVSRSVARSDACAAEQPPTVARIPLDSIRKRS